MKIDEAKQLCDGEPPEMAEKLLRLFPKDIGEYTREDFLEGTDPYDYLLLYKEDPFKLERMRQRLETAARKVGVKNFSKIFKEYCAMHGEDVVEFNVTNFPEQPLALRCGNYTCDQRGVKLDMELICPHPILMVARFVSIDTGTEKVKIAFSRGKGWRTNTIDRRIISTANKITELSALGISVTSESAKGLVKYLAKLDELNWDLIPEIHCASHLGWIDGGDDDEPQFVPYVGGIVPDEDPGFSDLFGEIREKGSFEKWHDEIVRCREYSVTAKIIIAASFASVLIKPLNLLPFFVHMWGIKSGTGKTVAQMAAASVWGNPESDGNFFRTFKNSNVGVELFAGQLHSLPFIMDELQMARDKYGKILFNVYELSSGVGKLRGTKTLGIAKTPTWRNCFITSGETPLTNEQDGAGALNRVIEIECTEGKKVIENGHRTAETLSENFGFAGRVFILKLLQEENLKLAKRAYDVKYEECLKSETTEKQAMAAAAILTADALAAEWIFFDNALTVKEMSEFLKSEQAVSAAERGYRYICDWVMMNQAKFGAAEKGDFYGVIEDGCAYVIRAAFEKACAAEGINSKALLSGLKATGRIITRKNGKGFTFPKRVSPELPPVNCVAVKLDTGDTDAV